jgi:hypothetical protein
VKTTLLLLAGLTAAAVAAPTDTVLKAMHDEMQRSMHQLRLPSAVAPYWMAYRTRQLDQDNLGASFGAVTQDEHVTVRVGTVDVRVGSYKLDSGPADFANVAQLPLDDNYEAIRRQFWYLSDQAYKRALTSYANRQQEAKQRQHPSHLADFTPAAGVVRVEALAGDDFSRAHWRAMLSRLSRRFRRYPAVRSSQVHLDHSVTTMWLTTSDGSMVRYRLPATRLVVEAEARAQDGKILKMTLPAAARRPEDLPSEEALDAQVDGLVHRLMAACQAPTQARYLGPVLLTGPAAPQFLYEILAARLSGGVSPGTAEQSDLGDRLQHRILPTFLSAEDDPTREVWHGLPLLGSYPVDAQGVPAQRVELVQQGRLKALLMGRQPGPELSRSNGHARTSSNVGPSNLLFSATSGVSADDLRRRLREECRKQGLPYGLEIVQLELAETNMNLSMLMGSRFMAMTSVPPVLVYRVDVATGQERPVRTGPLDEISLRTLRDIMAAGQDTWTTTYPGNLLFGTPPMTLASPSLLLEELEFKPYSAGNPAPVLLTNPYFR